MSDTSISGQMALDLFQDLRLSNTPITEAPTDIGFNRTNLFLDIEDVGLVGRRALDAAYFIVSHDTESESHDIDLGYFTWLMSYDSRNRSHLRAALREAQKAAIQVNEIDLSGPDQDRWISVPLLGAVGISGGRIVFQVHEALRRQLRDPKSYTYLSLRIKARLSSLSTASLYDRLAAVAYRGGTEWEEIETIKGWLQCSDSKTMSEFKYLKQRLLEPAIKLINEVTDINVRYETRTAPGTKRIDKIKFFVSKKNNIPTLADSHQAGSLELYETLRDEFGLSQDQFEEIGTNRGRWPDTWIQMAIEFTRDRLIKGKVNSPSHFLMKAIRDGLRVSHAERLVGEQQAAKKECAQKSIDLNQQHQEHKDKKEKEHTTKLSTEIAAAMTAFAKKSKKERAALVLKFIRTPGGKLAVTRSRITAADVTEELARTDPVLSKALGAFIVAAGEVEEPHT